MRISRNEIVCHPARSCVTLKISPLTAEGLTTKGLITAPLSPPELPPTAPFRYEFNFPFLR
jgi:hypothetical protein